MTECEGREGGREARREGRGERREGGERGSFTEKTSKSYTNETRRVICNSLTH